MVFKTARRIEIFRPWFLAQNPGPRIGDSNLRFSRNWSRVGGRFADSKSPFRGPTSSAENRRLLAVTTLHACRYVESVGGVVLEDDPIAPVYDTWQRSDFDDALTSLAM